jgi:hypothetical protein
MFGVWFLNTAIANKIAGSTGSYIDRISETYSLSTFFLIFTIIPIGAGLVLMTLNKWMEKENARYSLIRVSVLTKIPAKSGIFFNYFRQIPLEFC